MSNLVKFEGFVHKGIKIELPNLCKENTAYFYAARDLIPEVDKAIKILQEARKELEEEWSNFVPQKYY